MADLVIEKAEKWLASSIDESSKEDIRKLLTDSEALTEAFYKDLEFGTGGLRGIMGIGSNRMNKYTIGMATQGLSNYLKKTYPNEQIKVAIAHDSRNNSRQFAESTAAVFSANGIEVYLFSELRPTPELSFAIRQLGCHSGVVLTASHNPKEYNGYKAYWQDGAQLTAPHDKNVIDEVKKIASLDDVSFQENRELIHLVGDEMDEQYIERLKSLSLSPDAIAAHKTLKIVYSPIHGTGITVVPKSLKAVGFENITVVEDQIEPNGNFPTVVYPNPEEAEAMKLAMEKAKSIDADIVMATDPDADRVGIAIKNAAGDFELLNGNQTGCLLMYYVLERWSALGKLNGDQYVVKTIVTSDLMDTIANYYHVPCYNTLTGFKYIASIIRSLEGKKQFIVGGEESYGYLIGDFVRDKDAVASCMMLAEMVAYAKSIGLTPYEMLLNMYKKFGFYKETLISITKKGKKGAEEIDRMMSDFRTNPPQSFGNSEIIRLIDYRLGVEKDLTTGKESKIDFPSSNVLQFITKDGYKVSARPSGTEPKIKFYISVNTQLTDIELFPETTGKLEAIIDSIKDDLNL